MIGTVVPSGIRQRYFGINFILVNLGIAGVPAGSIVDVHRPGTSWRSISATRSASWHPSWCLSGPF